MDEDEDDDIYAFTTGATESNASHGLEKADDGDLRKAGEDLEEGEEEGEEVEESDSVCGVNLVATEKF